MKNPIDDLGLENQFSKGSKNKIWAYKNDGVSEISPEKLLYSKLTEEQRKGFEQTGQLIFNTKNEIEFNRYKQDCRKRALDLAHSETQLLLANIKEGNATTGNGEKLRTVIVDADPTTTLANQYYNWLISIPE